MTNVHVMADETLGGVLREFNEAKRKANVGERIKIVDQGGYSAHKVGTVWTVTDADANWGSASYSYRDGTGVALNDGNPLFHRRYVVLEPSDVIRVEGVRYRMVARKAHNDDRIVVTAFHAEDHASLDDPFRIGEVFTVTRVDSDGDVWYAKERDFDNVISTDEYRVLERIETSTTSKAPEPSTDALTTSLASIAVKVASLETELGVVKRELASMREQVAALSKPAQGVVDVAERRLTRANASEMTRDDVVRKAIEDVKTLLNDNYPIIRIGSPSVWFVSKGGATKTDRCDFVVNRDKRTVVALINLLDGRPVRKGVAKCASDDVFNVHIGKAIALRRALGLDVPDEYLKAPKPTDVRVGDVVESFLRDGRPYKTFEVMGAHGTYLYDTREKYDYGGTYIPFEPQYGDRVIDDSGRYETEASV